MSSSLPSILIAASSWLICLYLANGVDSFATFSGTPSTCASLQRRVDPTDSRDIRRLLTLHAEVEGFDGVLEVERKKTSDSTEESATQSHEIKYHVHRRMNMSSQQAAPIVVLHGGPGIPSHYLEPLQSVVPYRSILFYDQLGCGRSPGPDYKEAYSIETSLDDLEALLKKNGLRRFHLYGQSYGGILAFEYIKRMAERNSDDPKCLSVILSSAPCDVEQVEGVANRLVSNLMEEDQDETTIMERFRMQHQCQTKDMPGPLKEAYASAGDPGVWRGTDSIKGWKAVKPSEDAARMPSCMVMRGENDFVTEECVKGWKDAFNHNFVRMKVLDGCSHHGLLENGSLYGEIVDSYFAEYD